METVVFWVAWGIISFWTLKTFYYSFNKHKLESLRKAALGINLSVLILSLLPWLPPALDGKSGLALAFEGNILAVLLLILLVVSILLFLTKTPSNLKIASIATIVNTLTLFALMMQIRPGTFVLSLFDIAPIIAFMFLLIADVVVLLLWQQLQLGKNKKLNLKKSSKWPIIIFLALIPIFIWFAYQGIQPLSDGGKLGVRRVLSLKEVQKFKKEVEENGRSKFDLALAAEPSREDSFYLIQVSEIFPDHRTTFRWYRYYPDTKKVFTQFLERATTDNWDEVME